MYIVALPAFGIVSDLLSTHARRNIFGYRMMVWAILAIGCLSFVVWAHHMYVSGMNPYFGFFFATTTLIIAVPTAIKVYNWVLTIWRGDVHLTVPMLFAIGFIFTFVNGGLTGLFLGNVTVDVPLSGTYFVVAHFHMVMGVSPILVVFGAIYHWYPKITGRMLDETLGKIHFWFTFLGTYAIYLPMHYLGILGVPRRYYAYGNSIEFIPPSVQTANEWITISALFVAAVQMVFLFNLVWSYFHGKPAGPQSLARDHARMADARYAAEARQLGQGSAGRASLGLRLQRAGRAGGLHSAERAAGRRRTRRTRARSEVVSLTVAYRRAAHRHRGLGRCSSASCTAKSWEPQPADGETSSASDDRCRRRASGCGFSWRSSLRCSRCSSPRTTCAWASRRRRACTTGSRCPSRDVLWLNTVVLILAQRRDADGRARAVARRRRERTCDRAADRRPAHLRVPRRPVLRLAQLRSVGILLAGAIRRSRSSIC